ncbi:MAG: glutamate formiminotransferase, partial [Planctomycetes bacterium]|nr:glutamate formiminotransferase [Planctomycetota bacterium]
MAIIECVPNISEGRDKARIDAIGSVVNQTKGAKLVSIESDADHNRSVITFAGDEIGVYDAALAIFRKATGLIDLN